MRAATVAVAVQPPDLMVTTAAWVLIGGLTTAGMVIWFVGWQFSGRQVAADGVAVCLTLGTRWLTEDPAPGALEPTPFHRGYKTPHDLARGMQDVKEARCRGVGTMVRLPPVLTLLLMVVWTAIAVVRVIGAQSGA